MKKWKEYMMLAVLCISMVGCGKKDSGSELLTEVQETVTPVEEVVKPEGEETPEGIITASRHFLLPLPRSSVSVSQEQGLYCS